MKRFLVFVLFLLPAAAIAQLQVQFIRGTITTTDSTTITAYVRGLSLNLVNAGVVYRENPEKRQTEKIAAERLLNVDLENGEQYERLRFTDPEFKQPMTAMGRVLVRGTLTLYHTLSGTVTYFIVRNSTATYVLREDKISGARLDHYYFRNLLAAAAADEPELHQRAEHMNFNEGDIARFIADYNRLKTGQETLVKATYQKARFLLVFANSAVVKDPDIFLEGTARFYDVKFSHSLSLNVGVHYFNYRETVPDLYAINGKAVYSNVVRGTVFSVPLYAQENILNGRFRPFVFGGINLSINYETDDNNHFPHPKGFQKNYGINYIVGAGIEWNITPRLIIKSQWIHEYIDHPVFVGLGYCLAR